MAKTQEKSSTCSPLNDEAVKAFLSCLEKRCECIAIYIDYSALRYPVANIYGYITPCEEALPELEKFVGEIFLEITTTINLITNFDVLKNNPFEHITSLRIRCGNGWISYGYMPTRSQYGVPYVTKNWFHVSEEGEITVINIEELREMLVKLVGLVIEIAKKIFEHEF